jgi:trypsin
MNRNLGLITLALLVPACTAPAAGTAASSDAIVGGKSIGIQDVPWQVSIRDRDFGHVCGGVILSDRYILTAHHCFDADKREPRAFISPRFFQVAAGISKLSRTGAEGQLREIDDFIPLNDAYDRTNPPGGGDLALLRLAEPLRLGNKAAAIDFATSADERAGRVGPGQLATVSGWGATKLGGPLSDQLLVVDVPIVPLEIAERVDPKHRTFAADLIAAGGVNGKDSCNGDSGGPLVVGKKSHPLLAGVVSFGILDEGCGDPGLPAIYNGVAPYADLVEGYLCSAPRVLTKKDHLAGKANETRVFEVQLPAGQRELNINLFGGSGDADLMVRRGAVPTAAEHDCLSAVPDTSNESCNLGSPEPGTYFVAVTGFADYAEASLRVNAYKP